MAFDLMNEITWKFAGKPYDLNSILTPDQVWANLDTGAEEVRVALNAFITAQNALTASSSTGFTPNADVSLTANTVQLAFDALVTLLHGTTGAAWIKAVGIAGLTGDNVQALLESLKTYIDAVDSVNDLALANHKAGADHDGRYYTVDEVNTLDGANVKKTGDQTIAGVKTFSSSPIAPTPTASTQVANKAYVDDQSPLTIVNGSITDLKLSDDVGDIKERFESYKAETANLNRWPRIIPEVDDSARLQRALDSLPDGISFFIPYGVYNFTTTTLSLSGKTDVTIYAQNATLKTDSSVIMFKVSNCLRCKVVDLWLDGSEMAWRGLEVINSPFTLIINGGVSDIGNSTEPLATSGILIKEGCDFSQVINSKIDKIYSETAVGSASGIWISNFSDATNPELFSKHIIIDKCKISDVYPLADADGVKVLCGSYWGDIDLIVQNCKFINCRKRGIKFQARGCLSLNNYIEFNEPNAYSAIDFQRGHGKSIADKLVINLPVDFVPDSGTGLYYTEVHIAGPNVEIDKFETVIVNDLTPYKTGDTLLSRVVQIGSLESQVVKDINIHDCNFIGHEIEFTTDVANFTFKDNKFTVLNGSPLIQNGFILTDFIWDNNRMEYLGTTTSLIVTPIGGLVNISHHDGIERYLAPNYRDHRTEYHVKLSDTVSPMNYDIVNDVCVSRVNANPTTQNISRYNVLFKLAKKGDIAYKSVSSLGTDAIGTYISDRYICTVAPDLVTNLRGIWNEVREYYT